MLKNYIFFDDLKANIPELDSDVYEEFFDFCSFSDAIRLNDNVKNTILVTNHPEIYPEFISNNKINSKDKSAEQLKKEIEYICRDKTMSDKHEIFIIGDPHFQHKNIIRYCKRPWNSGIDENNEMIITDSDVERMNNDLIKNWNSVVKADDEVIVNGDFCLGNRKNVPEIVSQLNGHKKLILGNHDYFHINDKEKYKNMVDFYMKAGFEFVSPYSIVLDKFIIISHEPLEWVTDDGVYANIYAHVHNHAAYKDYTKRTFCSSAERINYTPINLKEIIKHWEE